MDTEARAAQSPLLVFNQLQVCATVKNTSDPGGIFAAPTGGGGNDSLSLLGHLCV